MLRKTKKGFYVLEKFTKFPELIHGFSTVCTSCQNGTFFSFRREGNNLSGEIASVIGLKGDGIYF